MISKEKVLNDICEYQKKYRNPTLNNKFDISDEYCLFPDLPKATDKGVVGNAWPNDYTQQFYTQGVYLVFTKDRLLTYVGKASLSSTISGRLDTYFSYEKDRVTCKVKHTWINRPEYVIAVAMPEGHAFEAPALEEYLITRYKKDLPDNTSGTDKNRSMKPKSDDAHTIPVD